MARSARAHPGRFSLSSATRSPGWTPSSTSPNAASSTSSRNSRAEMETKAPAAFDSMNSGRSCRSTAWRNSSGTVRGVIRGGGPASWRWLIDPELDSRAHLEVVEERVLERARAAVADLLGRAAEYHVVADLAADRDPVPHRVREAHSQ